ncbi:hypothetical protein EZV73_17710 [Acidaminobacter sp. JC074]|uniref:ribonuclease H-like domain-containing protein n=1 Tax=Acidaminobacter sp. JC074 TaxID=2530199 RepID=UPI001F10666E|nr:ribonuclease H-like domain-containing protein [Acidaminobacter sp. JC074]MCH4889422.1 hypothetical protein [Acidaminobacter sp. JC074]
MILDIETTGLSPKYTQVILVGIIYKDENKWLLTQIFCDHRSEEHELLKALQNYIKEDHMLITYNGYAFDIPYLNKRYKAHKMDYQINDSINFDLYRVIRSSKKELNLESYKLKNIEEYLGIYREDQISGKESVALYDRYEHEPSEELRDIILLHNSDDIEYMIPTFQILNHIPMDIIEKYYPFTYNSDDLGLITCTKYLAYESYIEVDFYHLKDYFPILDYQDHYDVVIQNKTVKMRIPLFQISDRSFIDIDLMDFLHENFNDLSYEDQVKYEVTSKGQTLTSIKHILKEYLNKP